MAVANSSFFSLTEEDDLILPSPQHSPLKEQDLGRGTSPGRHSFVEIKYTPKNKPVKGVNLSCSEVFNRTIALLPNFSE